MTDRARQNFTKFIIEKGVSKKNNSATAIWKVGLHDGVYLDILNEDVSDSHRAQSAFTGRNFVYATGDYQLEMTHFRLAMAHFQSEIEGENSLFHTV